MLNKNKYDRGLSIDLIFSKIFTLNSCVTLNAPFLLFLSYRMFEKSLESSLMRGEFKVLGISLKGIVMKCELDILGFDGKKIS